MRTVDDLLFRREEDDCLGDLACCGNALHGHVESHTLLQGVKFWFRHSREPVQVCLDKGGSHSVETDAKRSQLHRKTLCEHLKACLDHRVANEACLGATTLVTADVNDAATRLFHELTEELREDEGRAHVHINHVVVVLRIRSDQITCEDDSCTVDENV